MRRSESGSKLLDKDCHLRHKQGHNAKMCMNGRQKQHLKQRIRKPHMQTDCVEDKDTMSYEEDLHRLLRVTDSQAKPIHNTVNINKILITMDLDSEHHCQLLVRKLSHKLVILRN